MDIIEQIEHAMTKNIFFLMLLGLVLSACSSNNRSKELSCTVTDKDGQEWYITYFRDEVIQHNNGVVTNIGNRQKLEETNVFSGYNTGHDYYSLTFSLNRSNLIEKVVDRVPARSSQHTRCYEYNKGRLVKIVDELSEINDDKILDHYETEFIWEDEDIVEIVKQSVDIFDGSPYTEHIRILYGKEENSLRCLFASLPARFDIDVFVAAGYYGIGPKHIPIGIEYPSYTESLNIKLNPNGTVASEETDGSFSILYSYAYEKVK